MKQTLVVLLFAVLFSVLHISQCFTVPMRLLLLAAADDDATNQLIKLALDARGIPYNSILVPTGNFFLSMMPRTFC
jgi:hypothetical protein